MKAAETERMRHVTNFSESVKLLRYSSVFSGLALTMMPISISATEIMISLSFITFIAELTAARYIRKKINPNAEPDSADKVFHGVPAVFKAGLIFFGILIASSLFHCLLEKSAEPFRRGVKDELNDFPLMLFGLLVYFQSRQKENQRWFLLCLQIFIYLLLLSGAAAVFSQHRLAKIFTGSAPFGSASNRPQHPAFRIGEWIFYRPIGFMNTRLTYAGLLILILPFLFTNCIEKIRGRNQYSGLSILLSVFLSILGTVLLLLNETRSALMGAGAGIVLWIVSAIFLQNNKFPRFLKTAAIVSILSAATLTCFVVFSDVNPLPAPVRRQQSHFLRHTDFQRPIIWAGAGELIRDNLFLGIGPGNYRSEVLKWRRNYLPVHPDLWYFFECTPSGHAHNDFLHSTLTGGIAAGLAFLSILYFSIRRTAINAEADHSWNSLLVRSGPAIFASFALAGLAQCYFQDDEVAVFFWSMAALTIASGSEHQYSGPPDSEH